MKLRQQIFNDISDSGRSIHELARSIALLTPESSSLFPASNNFYLRSEFCAPESGTFYLSSFLGDFNDTFPYKDWQNWPWYAKAIALLLSGGCEESDKLFGEY